jgi:plasmid segregation protein ParM
MFSKKFTPANHEVTICNFEKNVHLNITFSNDVTVLPEGVSAQHAIESKGEELIEELLIDMRSRGCAVDNFTAKAIIKCGDVLSIDIGEGTVNLPVSTNGEYNSIMSTTLNSGFGTIIEKTLPAIRNANMPYSTRKQVVEIILEPEDDFNINKKKTIMDILNAESVNLANAIIREISPILSNGKIKVIYVYGGGATPMKEVLYNKLIEKTKNVSGGDVIPVLYLDSTYARYLNRAGLFDVAMKNYKQGQKIS